MPQQVEPTPFEKIFSRKTHDLPHLLPVTRPVAMHRTVLADWLRLKGTTQAPFNGVIEKIPALWTNRVPVQEQTGVAGLQHLAWPRMVLAAIDRGKRSENLEILDLLTG